jgi:hypothetical protein
MTYTELFQSWSRLRFRSGKKLAISLCACNQPVLYRSFATGYSRQDLTPVRHVPFPMIDVVLNMLLEQRLVRLSYNRESLSHIHRAYRKHYICNVAEEIAGISR